MRWKMILCLGLVSLLRVFEKSPDGCFDRSAGLKLRKEIYEVGDSRDVNISIEEFLGRPRSIEPFLRIIGIGKNTTDNTS